MGRTRKKRSKRRAHKTLRTRGGDLLTEIARIVSLRQTAQQKVDASQNINRHFLQSLKGGEINVATAKPIVNHIVSEREGLLSNYPFSMQSLRNALASNSPNEEAILRAAVDSITDEYKKGEDAANEKLINEIKQFFTSLSNPRKQAATAINQKWKNITRRASHASQMKMVNALRGIHSPVSEEKEDDEKKDVQKSLLFFDKFNDAYTRFKWIIKNDLGLNLVSFYLTYTNKDRKSQNVIVISPDVKTPDDKKMYYIKFNDTEIMKNWIFYSMKLIRYISKMEQSDITVNILRLVYHLTRIISYLLYKNEEINNPSKDFRQHTYRSLLCRLVCYVISYMAIQDERIFITMQQIIALLKEKGKEKWKRDILPYGITVGDIENIAKVYHKDKWIIDNLKDSKPASARK